MFLFSLLSMTTKFIILFRYCTETEVGKTRKRETAEMSIWQIMGGYGDIFKRIFTSQDMILALIITTIFSITGMISGSFFGLYVTGTLLIPEHILAYFHIIRSFVVTTLLFTVQPRLDRFGFRRPILVGLIVFLASLALLIFTPVSTLYILIIYILLDAVAFSFVVPRGDSLVQLLVDPTERARIRGLIMVVVLGLSMPFGYLAGFLSDIDRRYPFLLIAVFFALMFVVIAFNKAKLDTVKKLDGRAEQES